MFSQKGRWGRTSVQTSSNRFLKTLTEGAVTMEAGSLFQYFTTLTENAGPLLRRRLAPWRTLKGCPLRPRRAGGRKVGMAWKIGPHFTISFVSMCTYQAWHGLRFTISIQNHGPRCLPRSIRSIYFHLPFLPHGA